MRNQPQLLPFSGTPTTPRHRPYHFRKVYEHGQYREERLYLGGVEVYRKSLKSTGVVQDERETVHLSDDHRRVCMASRIVRRMSSRVPP